MTKRKVSLGDQYAEITVIVITVIALLLGWFYKSSIENASLPFESQGITAQTPKGWLQSSSNDELLRTIDINSTGFGATYVIHTVAITSEATASDVATTVALNHAQNLLGFRVLNQRAVKVYGRDAYEISYVFVESNPDVTHNDIPSIVRGVDYVFLSGQRAVVVSFQADENNFDLDFGRFERFLQSLSF